MNCLFYTDNPESGLQQRDGLKASSLLQSTKEEDINPTSVITTNPICEHSSLSLLLLHVLLLD
jgi:hypothetical protein